MGARGLDGGGQVPAIAGNGSSPVVQPLHDVPELVIGGAHGDHHPHGGHQLEEDGLTHGVEQSAEEQLVTRSTGRLAQVASQEGG